jgi:hypothetical protein
MASHTVELCYARQDDQVQWNTASRNVLNRIAIEKNNAENHAIKSPGNTQQIVRYIRIFSRYSQPAEAAKSPH